MNSDLGAAPFTRWQQQRADCVHNRLLSVLLISSDRTICEAASEYLREERIQIGYVDSGEKGLLLAAKHRQDVIIIDENLPGLDGLSVLGLLCGEARRPPVLFLVSDDAVERRVEALSAGADDSISRPIAIKELGARIRVLARRSNPGVARLHVGEIEIDQINRVATRDGKVITLQAREFDLLAYLACNAGQILTRQRILEDIWKLKFDPQTNLVETHICRLRSKINQGFTTQMIRTIRGVGYVMSA